MIHVINSIAIIVHELWCMNYIIYVYMYIVGGRVPETRHALEEGIVIGICWE